jgi:hypothetical protein
LLLQVTQPAFIACQPLTQAGEGKDLTPRTSEPRLIVIPPERVRAGEPLALHLEARDGDTSVPLPPPSDPVLLVLREGVDPAGRELLPVMPRFALADADVAAVLAWLHLLDRPPAPAVDDDKLDLGLLLPDAGANPAVARVPRLAKAVIAQWNSAGGFWGRRLIMVAPRSPTAPPDVFTIILRSPQPQLGSVPDRQPRLPPEALAVFPLDRSFTWERLDVHPSVEPTAEDSAPSLFRWA